MQKIYTRNRFVESHNSALRAKESAKYLRLFKKGYIFFDPLLKYLLMGWKIENHSQQE